MIGGSYDYKRNGKKGFNSGIITLIVDPNIGNGTVCKIGDFWFYFGGYAAEDMTPEDYINNVPEEDIVNEIFDMLDCFRNFDSFSDEYRYYEAFLIENCEKSNACIVAEQCPHCKNEIKICWDIKKFGHKVYCPICGKQFVFHNEYQCGKNEQFYCHKFANR